MSASYQSENVMQRVAFLSIQYPPTIGGLQKYISGIIELAPDNVELHVITVEPNPTMKMIGDRRLEAVYLKAATWFKSYPLINPIKVLTELKKYSFNRVIVVYPFPIILDIVAIFCFFRGVTVDCVYVDDIVLNGFIGFVGNLYEKCFSFFTRRLFSRVFGLSASYLWKSTGLKGYTGKIIEMPPFVFFPENIKKNTARANARKQMNLSHYKMIFLFVGGLRERLKYKRIDIILKAWAKTQSGTNNRLLIAGGGELDYYYKNLADSYKAGNIDFTGFVPDDTLNSLYLAADVFCIASDDNNEAFGLVCVEAMGCGCAVVATAIPGFLGSIGREKLDGVYLARPGNVDSFAEGIKFFINHLKPDMATENMNYVKNHFSREVVANKVRTFFGTSDI